jgi:uncharacterized protein (UPF0335 family)
LILNSALLFAAAQQIDDLDGQARDLANQKKDIFDNIKETVSPAEFKAWKDAVKLRQKRVHKRVEIEAHDELVFEMLSMLEAQLVQVGAKRAVTPEILPANSLQNEKAPPRAHEAEKHDSETGEIIETQSHAEVASEAVIVGNGEITPNAIAMDANKTLSTHREVVLPSEPPPEPIPARQLGEAAEPNEPSRDGPESSAADIGDIPDFLRRVA